MEVLMIFVIWGAGLFLGWNLRAIKLTRNKIKSLDKLIDNVGTYSYEEKYKLLYDAMDTY